MSIYKQGTGLTTPVRVTMYSGALSHYCIFTSYHGAFVPMRQIADELGVNEYRVTYRDDGAMYVWQADKLIAVIQ